MNRRERRAQKSKTNAGALAPAAQCEAGHRYLQSGKLLEARLCCERLLASDPNHAGALHLMGLISFEAKEYDHALEWIASALKRDPKPEYLLSLGATLSRQGRHDDALKAFDKAVELRPEDAGLWRQLGDTLLNLRRNDHALLSFQHVVKLDSRHHYAAYRSGILLNEARRFEEAQRYLDICHEVSPNHVPTLQARAWTLFNLKKFEEALAESLKIDALLPDNPETITGIGACLQSLRRDEEALAWLDRAIERLPNSIELLNGKASVLGQFQHFEEALALYDQIRALHLNNATTDWNLALLQMLLGDFAPGWPGREARFAIPDPSPYPKFNQLMWLGEVPIDGKTILIHVDEGLGDTIQFIRYVPMVAARGARIILVVERPMVRLLSSFPGVSQCLAVSDESLPDFDLHCPIGTLPMVFGTRLDGIPAETSYLPLPPKARIQAFSERLGAADKLRVGLVWSGSRLHWNDHNRSICFRMLSRILDVEATFVSLQKDPRPEDKAELDVSNVIDWTDELADFADTAALVKCLDLVITVDTSVAHLAAALGCPTWILLPWTPDYRWLLERKDSPWYPTVRLFRQSKTREYASVLDTVRVELHDLVAGRQSCGRIT
jgi:tetratricopeptide (TPR) repeat protein